MGIAKGKAMTPALYFMSGIIIGGIVGIILMSMLAIGRGV
jgi:hypothetical protein